MENTLENKAKFFALYWGQIVGKINAYHKNVISKISTENIESIDFIELHPLSSITDQDAIEVIKMNNGLICDLDDLKSRVKKGESSFSPSVFKQYYFSYPQISPTEHIVANFSDYNNPVSVCNGRSNWESISKSIFYLITKGYYVGDGSEVEYGWVKLKDK